MNRIDEINSGNPFSSHRGKEVHRDGNEVTHDYVIRKHIDGGYGVRQKIGVDRHFGGNLYFDHDAWPHGQTHETRSAAKDWISKRVGNKPHTITNEETIGEGKKQVGALTSATKKRLARVKKVAASMQKKTNEDVDQIDELSKKTVSSYKKKSNSYIDNASPPSPINMKSKYHDRKEKNRIAGGVLAARKLSGGARVQATEQTQIDELSKDTLKSYVAKSISQQKDITKTSTKKFDRKPFLSRTDKDYAEQDARSKTFYKRFRGSEMAKKKLAKEEVAQIDELSKKTLASYVGKALNDYGDRRGKADVSAHNYRNNTSARGSKRDWDDAEKSYDGARKRKAGIKLATKKLAKEEVQIDEVSKNTLKSYVAKSTAQQKNIVKTGAKLDKKPFLSRTDRDLFNEDLVEEAHSVSFIHPESGLRKRFNVIGARDYHSAKRVVASHLGLKNTRHVRANKRRITWEHVEPVLADGTLHEGGFQHGFYHVKRDGNVLRPTHGAPMSSEDAARHAKTVGGEYAFSNGRGEWHEAGLKKTPVQYRGMARNHMIVRGKYTPLGDTLVDDR